MKETIKNEGGFTLIELLVVITIIGVLATFAVVSIKGARAKARDAVRQNDMNQIGTAMQMYYSENTDYPTVGTCGDADVIAAALNGPLCDGGQAMTDSEGDVYFQIIPVDPLNVLPQQYYYDDQSTANTYCIQVNLERTADADDDDWFICRDGACYPSATDCDGAN